MRPELLVITFGKLSYPSTHYRIGQFLPAIGEYFTVRTISKADVAGQWFGQPLGDPAPSLLLNQKSLFGWWTDRQLRRSGMPRLFDFDDAIWTRHPKPYTGLSALKVRQRFRRAIEGHDLILTPNEFLAGYARQFNSRVEVIPMSLDTTQWCPQPRRNDGVFRIGWAGHPMAHGHLRKIAPLLKPLLAAHPDIRLSVYSGKRPELDLPFDYVPWQAGHEHEFTAGLDVGLLPLDRSEFNAGKSPIKAIQYLACGVPIVGNLFGAGAEIGDASNSLAVEQESDWAAQLERLYRDRDRCRAMGSAGREKALRQHSLQTNTPRHVDALRSLLPG